MSSSSSKPQNTTSSVTNASESNFNQSGTTGLAIGGNKGSTAVNSNNTTDVTSVDNSRTVNVSTDQGAISGGVTLGLSAIQNNSELAHTVIAGNNDVTNNALAFASGSEATSSSLVSQALSSEGALVQAQSEQNQSFLTEVLTGQTQQFNGFANTLEAVTQSAAQSVQDIAQANATPQSTQQTDFLQTAIKYVVIGVVVIAVAYAVTRRG